MTTIDSRQWAAARAADPSAVAFPDYPLQVQAVTGGSVLSPLTAFSLLRFSGEDARTFLQGQLSSDVQALDGSSAQLSTYSSAKGRVQASFLLWQRGDDYYALIAADLAAAICQRLKMFILRSRVVAEQCDDMTLLGFCGPDAEAWLAAQRVLPPAAQRLCAAPDGAMCVALPGNGWLLALPAAVRDGWLAALPPNLVPVDAEAWTLRDILAGIPWVTAATREQFVAQMVNMDALGAISFTKGCYPGQEIVARTRYLGKVKRRLFRVKLPHQAAVGTVLYSPAVPDQSIGMLVNCARDSSGEYQALAVVQTAAWEQGVYLNRENIDQLEKLSLPYTVADE